MIILLDIDGVMVSEKSWEPHHNMEDGFTIFNKNAIINLNKVISKTNATIILTTSPSFFSFFSVAFDSLAS